MANIRDVARRAGVAISTVSFALNGTGPVSAETRRKVMQAVEETGYHPNTLAQSLKRGHSKMLGLVLGDIGNPFFGRLLREIEGHTAGEDYILVVTDTNSRAERERQVLSQLRRNQVGGVIMAPLSTGQDFAAYLQQFDMPVVLIDQDVAGSGRDFVGADHRLATRMLTDYLLRMGHERIAFLGGDPSMSAAALRLAGYREALEAAGLPLDPGLLAEAQYSGARAHDMTAQLLSARNRPTAIIAANNMMALGALRAIQELGFRCPEDVSLAGIDDVPWADVITPRITAVCQPIEELGAVATRFLLDRIGAKGQGAAGQAVAGQAVAPRRHVTVPRLVPGGSCAPPAG